MNPSLALHACLCVERTVNLFNMNVMAVTGWEGVMRVRCSKGLSISQFHGHFFVRSIDLLSLPQVGGSCLQLAAPKAFRLFTEACQRLSKVLL